ncbi:MAG: hypothetical protein H7301_02450 [Cryobacterium sp.]|nr:hypothetical protein [Oligoflexia bacterium]
MKKRHQKKQSKAVAEFTKKSVSGMEKLNPRTPASTLMTGEPDVRDGVTTHVAMDEKLAESRGDSVDQAQDQIDADIQEQIYQSRNAKEGERGTTLPKRRPAATQPPGLSR